MKKIFVLIVAVVFVLSMTVVCLANGVPISGTITKISGNKVTVQDEQGRQRIITTNSKTFKVGDKVTVKDMQIQSLDSKNLAPK